jgi:type I restriction enzyme S subunit
MYYGEGMPWIKTGELNDSFVCKASESVTKLAVDECHLPISKPGDVLIAMYGATIGKLGICKINCVTNQACCSCTPYEYVDNQFLFYFLMAARPQIIQMAAGGAQPNISKEKILAFQFSFPKMQQQKMIVSKIEEIFSKLSWLYL